MAELPGWRRFPPAEQWLQRNAPVAATPNLQDLKAIFSRFIDERQQATGGAPMTQQEKDQLFGQFERCRESNPLATRGLMRMVRWLVVRAFAVLIGAVALAAG